MMWTKSQQTEIINYVYEVYGRNRIELETNSGIFSILWYSRLDKCKDVSKKELATLKNEEVVLIEERERGKIWMVLKIV